MTGSDSCINLFNFDLSQLSQVCLLYITVQTLWVCSFSKYSGKYNDYDRLFLASEEYVSLMLMCHISALTELIVQVEMMKLQRLKLELQKKTNVTVQQFFISATDLKTN